MLIKNLKINNLRIIESSDTRPGPGLNLFHGHNGAGKTTLLEALAILARGRSFRSGPVGAQIGPLGDSYTLVCEIETISGKGHRLGLERSRSEWRARRDGQDVRQLTELSALLPLVTMHPENYTLVSGPPENRRRYLDWGVFHVKHAFLDDWRRYSRALAQRNAAIRQGAASPVVGAMDPQLVELGEQIDQARQREVGTLSNILQDVLNDLSDSLADIDIKYQPGWNGDDFGAALTDNLQSDRERGWTASGPHRAELVFRAGGKLARDRLSRGEQKLLYVALHLAQASRIQAAGETPVLLIDDLASEFDEDHLERVLNRCLELGSQVLVTGTSLAGFSPERLEQARVFHVKQGEITDA